MESLVEPTSSQILVPAGISPSALYNRVPLAIATTSAAAVLFWDHLQLMPHELKAIRSTEAPHWRPWDLSAFLLLRYAGIAAMIGYLYLHVVGQANCGAIMLVAQIGYITSVGAACFLLALRVANMMWSNDKSVTIWLALLGSATVACRAAVASQSGVSQVPQIPFTSNCILRPFVSWIAVEHASVLAFDVFCLVFALGKLGDQRRSPSFEMLHYRRCVPYYVAATLGNAGMLVIQLLSSDYDHVKAAAIPFSILISVATASRIALNTRSLRQFRQHFEDQVQGSSMSQPSIASPSVRMGQAPNLSPQLPMSSVTSSPTVVLRKFSDPFTERQPPLSKTSMSSIRSRTPSPLPLAQIGVDFALHKEEIDIEQNDDPIPDTPEALSPQFTPRTGRKTQEPESPAVTSPMTFRPGSTLAPQAPTTAPSTPFTGTSQFTIGSPMSEMEFAPTARMMGNAKPNQLSRGGPNYPLATPSPSTASTVNSFPSPQRQRILLDVKVPSMPASPPLQQSPYTSFPSPPSSVRSLTFVPPSARSATSPISSPFGNLAKLKRGQKDTSPVNMRSGWTE